jgi:hypothetical protein
VKLNGRGKRTSLLHYSKNYGRKKFYSTGPWTVVYILEGFLLRKRWNKFQWSSLMGKINFFYLKKIVGKFFDGTE